jgi:hypothetical protein
MSGMSAVPAHRLDDLALTGDQGGEVDGACLGRDAGNAADAGAMARLGRGQQRLGGNAADVHARAADRAAVDDRDP